MLFFFLGCVVGPFWRPFWEPSVAEDQFDLLSQQKTGIEEEIKALAADVSTDLAAPV